MLAGVLIFSKTREPYEDKTFARKSSKKYPPIALFNFDDTITIGMGFQNLLETSLYLYHHEKGSFTSLQLHPGKPEKGLRPNFRGRMESNEFDVEIALDSLGFRSPTQFGDQQNLPPLNITLLGDSFMFGWGVEQDSSFAAYLAKELNRLLDRRVFITNLGLPATGQVTHLNLLINTPQPNPDIIIAGLYIAEHSTRGNDLFDNINAYYKSLAVKKGKKQAVDNRDIGAKQKLRNQFKYYSNLYRLVDARIRTLGMLKLNEKLNIEKNEQAKLKAWQITDSLIVGLAREAKRLNATLICQYIPSRLDVIHNNNRVYDKLQDRVSQYGIKIAPNPMQAFHNPKSGFVVEDYYFTYDDHWKSLAHRLSAEQTATFIVENWEW